MNKIFTSTVALYMAFSSSLAAQSRDSAQLISEVSIEAYRKPVALLASTKSVSVAGQNFLNQNAPDRLMEAVNLLPGARMEERSPGSYRLSVRGSSLRSPFGVRNVKVYLEEFLLTDVSGNTYLNVLDPEMISRIEVYKGPEGGEFGSVTGGTVQLNTQGKSDKSARISGGEFNNFKGTLRFAGEFGKHTYQLFSGYQTTQSYREQSALERKVIYLTDRLSYSGKGSIGIMLLSSNLHYETPGGLTLEQMTKDRRQARPGTATLPGAVDQMAGIYNNMVLTGISHRYRITPKISHFMAVQASYNDFKNPFITNYEQRYERNLAFRTYLNFETSAGANFFQTRLGAEGGGSKSVIRNFDNEAGVPGAAQNFDDIFARSGFIYLSQKAELSDRFFIDASLSLNMTQYRWQGILPETVSASRQLKNEFLPSLGIAYLIMPDWTVRAKVSKGNSAPTIEELRSSAQQYNSDLAAEYGWNVEVGMRKQFGNSLYLEAGIFDFRLKDAIVRRQTGGGQEYFINAGSTSQQGLEAVLETKPFQLNTPFLKSVKFWLAGSFYDFRFIDYKQNENDYSGNKLTGVPMETVQSLLTLKFARNLGIDLAHFYTSEIALNDSNTVFSEPSLISNITVSYPWSNTVFKAELSLSVMNLYNKSYSLGHDINAFGNRFYNPAAKRNVLAGIRFRF